MAATTESPGVELRRRREALGLTREHVATEAPCSLAHLAALERGFTPERSRVLARVADALDRLEAAEQNGAAA
jgi:transcriptional regulator with XRE-family HTH domain